MTVDEIIEADLAQELVAAHGFARHGRYLQWDRPASEGSAGQL